MTQSSDHADHTPACRLLAEFDSLPSLQAELSTEAIHRIRIAIKQTRAWLKMYRGVSGDTPAYPQLVADLRRLSHAFSGLRDRDVALQTLAKLARKYPGKKARHLIEVLSQQIAQGQIPVPDTASLDLLIGGIRQQLATLTAREPSRETQIAVIDRAWTKMCKAGDTALSSAACSELHAWRKRVKSLAYQTAMVDASLIRRKKTQTRLNKLGRHLGEIHDLCFLQTMVEEIATTMAPPPELAPLHKRITRERHRRIVLCRKYYRWICPAPRH